MPGYDDAIRSRSMRKAGPPPPLLLAAFLVAILASGCPAPSGGGLAPLPSGPGTQAEQHDELFVQEGSTFTFQTSDRAFWGPNGFTLWALPLPEQQPFVQRTVELAKDSGDEWAGYGIVFCQYDMGGPTHEETMLLAMINTQQQYSVGEATGSIYTPYTSPTWVSCPSLARGYGMSNTVAVSRDADGLFTVVMNACPVMSFRDGRRPLQGGGADGFLVVISPQDSFPQHPVRVRYVEK